MVYTKLAKNIPLGKCHM